MEHTDLKISVLFTVSRPFGQARSQIGNTRFRHMYLVGSLGPATHLLLFYHFFSFQKLRKVYFLFLNNVMNFGLLVSHLMKIYFVMPWQPQKYPPMIMYITVLNLFINKILYGEKIMSWCKKRQQLTVKNVIWVS